MAEGYVLSLIYLGFLSASSHTEISHPYLPKAAVFKVPNGRFRSETGSHTSISPSKIMLDNGQRTISVYNSNTTHLSTLESNAASMKGVRLPVPICFPYK